MLVRTDARRNYLAPEPNYHTKIESKTIESFLKMLFYCLCKNG